MSDEPTSARRYIAGVLGFAVVLGAALVVAMNGSGAGNAPAPASSPVPPAPVTTVSANPLDGILVGNCLRNSGTDASPAMVPGSCGHGSFVVLARNAGTVDANVCAAVAGHTHNYTVEKYELTKRDGNEVRRDLSVRDSYVFCLRQQ
ncbi:LppU/SCO3897 family protein [Lentzea sp.]|uniref:LppU/SCO3897 family protein n=1 Tax=Lentzea sp. TaxID=56099 RepID=UPI002ECFD465